MCYYRYVYYSRCQHAEFYRYTYCDKAYALGQPQRQVSRSTCSTSSHSADSNIRDARRALGDTQAGPIAYKTAMSTLTPTEAGGLRKQPVSPHRVRLPHADLVPRSVKHDAPLNTLGYRNMNIDIPLATSSSVSMDLTHDGKAMVLPLGQKHIRG